MRCRISTSVFKKILSLSLLVFSTTVLAEQVPAIERDQIPTVETRVISAEILNPIRDDVKQLLETSRLSRQDDSRTNRATLQYGYDYFKLENNNHDFTEIPKPLQDLGAAILKSYGLQNYEFTNVIVSQYLAGDHLEPHQDTDKTMMDNAGYYFDEDIFGVILEADETGHLFFIYDTSGDAMPQLGQKHIIDLPEQYGDVYKLSGKIRTAPFFHGVSTIKNSRISVTFRRVLFN